MKMMISDHEMAIPFEAHIIAFLIAHIQKTIPLQICWWSRSSRFDVLPMTRRWKLPKVTDLRPSVWEEAHNVQLIWLKFSLELEKCEHIPETHHSPCLIAKRRVWGQFHPSLCWRSGSRDDFECIFLEHQLTRQNNMRRCKIVYCWMLKNTALFDDKINWRITKWESWGMNTRAQILIITFTELSIIQANVECSSKWMSIPAHPSEASFSDIGSRENDKKLGWMASLPELLRR